jgi:hypothetical protein
MPITTLISREFNQAHQPGEEDGLKRPGRQHQPRQPHVLMTFQSGWPAVIGAPWRSTIDRPSRRDNVGGMADQARGNGMLVLSRNYRSGALHTGLRWFDGRGDRLEEATQIPADLQRLVLRT